MYNITKNGGYIIIEVPNNDDDLQELANNLKNASTTADYQNYLEQFTEENPDYRHGLNF